MGSRATARLRTQGIRPVPCATEELRRPNGIVRVSRAFYQNIPPSEQTYYAKDWFGEYDNATGRHRVGQFDIPNSQLLDVTSVRWRFLLPSPEPGVLQAVGDWYICSAVRLHFLVNDREVADYGFTLTAPATAPQPGWGTLNRNFFEAEDMPFHLLFEENSRIYLEYDRLAAVGFDPPDGSYIGVEVRGRWIPKGVWDNMKEDLR